MKNTVKLFGAIRSIAIIALVAVIGFSFASCDDSGSGGPDRTAGTRVTITEIPEEFIGVEIVLDFGSSSGTVTVAQDRSATLAVFETGPALLRIANSQPFLSARRPDTTIIDGVNNRFRLIPWDGIGIGSETHSIEPIAN